MCGNMIWPFKTHGLLLGRNLTIVRKKDITRGGVQDAIGRMDNATTRSSGLKASQLLSMRNRRMTETQKLGSTATGGVIIRGLASGQTCRLKMQSGSVRLCATPSAGAATPASCLSRLL